MSIGNFSSSHFFPSRGAFEAFCSHSGLGSEDLRAEGAEDAGFGVLFERSQSPGHLMRFVFGQWIFSLWPGNALSTSSSYCLLLTPEQSTP